MSEAGAEPLAEPAGEPPAPKSEGSGPSPLVIGGALAAIAAVVVVVLLVSGGGGDDGTETTVAQTTSSTPSTTSTTTQTTNPPAGTLIPGEWREVNEAPSARQQVAATAVKGQIFVVGGLTESGGSTKVEVFDPFINTWRSAPDLPVSLHHAMAVSYRGELVVIGGWTPEGADLLAITSPDVYALRGDTWEELPPLPEPRAAGAADRGRR